MGEQTKVSQSNKHQDKKQQGQQYEHALAPIAHSDSGIGYITNNRPEAIAQRKLQNMMDNSPQVQKGIQLQSMIDNSPRQLAQRKVQESIGNSPQVQKSFKMQAMMDNSPRQLKKKVEEELATSKENKTGLHDHLKTGIENLSGMSMDNVKVHTGSSKPSQLNALAYAQGNEIHLGPGQERHLPHEAWHVVQQTIDNNHGEDPVLKDDYRRKIENSIEYQQFVPNESLIARIDKWTQFHSCGETTFLPDLEEDAHIPSDNNNTYTSLSIKYRVSLSTLLNLNRVLIKKHGEYIPSGSRVFVFHRTNVLDEYPQHLIYEFAAHHLVYKQAYTPLNKEELAILSKAGYLNPDQEYAWQTGSIGFQALLIPSSKTGVNDLLAIRGTKPGLKSSDSLTVVTDTDEKAVGALQFASNKEIIENKLLSRSSGKVDVVGHSLGGAMAQHIAANYDNKIANVVTFQSPGIDHVSVNKFLKIPEKERPKSVHHFVKGDQVDKSGDEKLPGVNIEHDFNIHQTLPSEILISVKFHFNGIKQGMTEFGMDMKEASIMPLKLIGVPDRYPASLYEAIDMLTANIPTLENIKEKDQIIKKMIGKIQEMKEDLSISLDHGSKLIEFLNMVIEAEGEAHTKHLFSASGFMDKRIEAGITDKFMMKATDDTLRKKGEKDPKGGMEIEEKYMNETSYQIPRDGDGYSSERLIGEGVRSAVGKGRDKVLTMGQIVKITKSVQIITETIQSIKQILVKIIKALSSLLIPDKNDFDKIKSHFEILWKEIQNIAALF